MKLWVVEHTMLGHYGNYEATKQWKHSGGEQLYKTIGKKTTHTKPINTLNCEAMKTRQNNEICESIKQWNCDNLCRGIDETVKV